MMTRIMNKQELIKQIAHRMIQRQLHSKLGKKELHESFKARVNKKKLPEVKPKKEPKRNEEYKNLSIEEYEKLYPSF